MRIFLTCVLLIAGRPLLADFVIHPEPVGPVIQPEAVIGPRVSVFSRPRVYSYSMVYNIQGDWNPSTAKIANHIAREHGINPAGMSRAEMLMAHDRAHGVRVAAPRRVVRYAPVASSCPGGVCPVGRNRR
jgi:hypothetical protein